MNASRWPIVAMRQRGVLVAVVCMARDYVVMESGQQLPVSCWLDKKKRPCRKKKARYYEFGTPETGYAIGNLDSYDMPSYLDH